METKTCIKCGRELPLNKFYKNKNCKDGHSSWCKECAKQYSKQNYRDNKDEILEQQKQYYQENRETIAEQQKQYRQEHKDERAEWQKQYRQTPIGRAFYLVSAYKQKDNIYNRGECTITPQWVVNNIFTQPCHWCGETDWTKLGCDRIDNSKPHTPDNVLPCCEECNTKRNRRTYEEYSLMI